MIYALGKHIAPGQAPIFVVDNGATKGLYQGPWIRWRFPWNNEEETNASLFFEFDSMYRHAGYQPEEGENLDNEAALRDGGAR